MPVAYSFSGDSGIGTHELLNTIQELSQLGYTPHFLPTYISNLDRFLLSIISCHLWKQRKNGAQNRIF